MLLDENERQLMSRAVSTPLVVGAEDEHAHEGLAFTTWLDFEIAAEQARAVTRAPIRKQPQLKAIFETSCGSLEKDLLQLDASIKDMVSRKPSTPLVVSHPAYDYFTQRNGLNTRSVHWEPDRMPTAD